MVLDILGFIQTFGCKRIKFSISACCFSTGLSRCKKHNPFPRGLLLSNLLNLQDGKYLLNLQRCRALVTPRASHRWHTLSFTCPRWSCGAMRLPERWPDYRLLLDHCAAGVREGDKRQTVLARLLSAGPTYSHHLHVLLIFKPHKHAHANTNSWARVVSVKPAFQHWRELVLSH